MTFYLKYRPQKIEEIDLTEVRESLGKLAKNPEIPHAFLFAGPRGAGKTSTARILAKVVNCEDSAKDKGPRTKGSPPAGGEPCNKCGQCMAITKGTSLNVIEIDAASHRGVDDIRALRETVKLSPAGGTMKVYIIDEAHMLTTEAANALLKTLEEPPAHAIFILATTAPEKLPDTIRSRCMTLVFRKGKQDEVIRSLERAVKGESVKIEKDALYEIAKNVDGSFREAHKILEQLNLGKEKITEDRVKEFFELAAADPEKLLVYFSERDVEEALREIDKTFKKGTNLKVYTTKILEMLRKTMISKIMGEKDTGEFSGKFKSAEELIALTELFSEAVKQIPTAVIPQLPLEIAVVKWCVGDSQAIESGGRKLEVRNEKLDEDVRGEKKSVPASHIPHPTSNLEEEWREIMRLIKLQNHSAEALLRATKPRQFDGKILEIEVFYEFHKERLEKEPYRTLIESVGTEVFGKNIRLVCKLSSSKQKAVDLVNITEVVEEDITKIAEEIFGDGKNNAN